MSISYSLSFFFSLLFVCDMFMFDAGCLLGFFEQLSIIKMCLLVICCFCFFLTNYFLWFNLLPEYTYNTIKKFNCSRLNMYSCQLTMDSLCFAYLSSAVFFIADHLVYAPSIFPLQLTPSLPVSGGFFLSDHK